MFWILETTLCKPCTHPHLTHIWSNPVVSDLIDREAQEDLCYCSLGICCDKLYFTTQMTEKYRTAMCYGHLDLSWRFYLSMWCTMIMKCSTQFVKVHAITQFTFIFGCLESIWDVLSFPDIQWWRNFLWKVNPEGQWKVDIFKNQNGFNFST